ncbi:MAG: tRNA pseudouridine(55) synthase TruB [Candidatus Colwellbacteria bacterium CG10_big_fil_rev_8_21_14_0_10_42_22]|uniref:tRNA pseudouridine synthase B n=1 Tax=Candidatus Colwellbacteria bacterium CG10_big_fil_rev_8_21_14_0_10_42_22 TaxID=1974540 RepID=A0A2H0VGJ4_9BACT|nr:MAG: tRNA pseudouridine(55) synthase TruB [Candidatus Colwellbacteria bacterium CG10_big_fil_rev_8_21_14_0_10_42_22]
MILNINKPAGITSHDVVDRVRKITGVRKVGHGGTLDPFATGVLVVGVGRESTKKLGEISRGTVKEYEATIELGKTSTTGDPEGKIINTANEATVSAIGLQRVEEVLVGFLGETSQTPPIYSALKIKGVPAYKLARKGLIPKLEKRDIKIDALEIVKHHPPFLQIRVAVSSGTYIRSLAGDIGKALGVGGYLKKLKRTRVGEYTVDQSQNLADLQKEFVKSSSKLNE